MDLYISLVFFCVCLQRIPIIIRMRDVGNSYLNENLNCYCLQIVAKRIFYYNVVWLLVCWFVNCTFGGIMLNEKRQQKGTETNRIL